ncbi:MAG: hypothetical protein V7K68_31035 [Nostoc sp.]|uniref:hypothetical protein n=1 Tax=Nostoc sp. TaxID=1180 RepID=UPI002FF9E3CE
MEPVTLTAAWIATLVITKAFEKTGEILGEKALEQSGNLLDLLQKSVKQIQLWGDEAHSCTNQL